MRLRTLLNSSVPASEGAWLFPPALNTAYWTEDRPDTFCLQMAQLAGISAGDVIAFGHTHKPWYREVNGIHFVNTGSAGRPKDDDWRAGYVVVDAGADTPAMEFVRVEYDLERATRGIVESELPNEFAVILETGGRLTAKDNQSK